MNLVQISNRVILILTIAVLNSDEQNNFNISNYIHFPYYMIPVHYCIQLDYINPNYEHTDKLDNIWKEMFGLKNEYDSFFFRGKTSTTINILQSTHYISLNQLKLIISLANITLTTKNAIIYVLNKYKYSKNVLGFPLLYMLLPGLYTFKIQFFSHLRENHEDSFFKNVSKGNIVTLVNYKWLKIYVYMM
ncbi:hypothetical protein ALC57_05373 [Trachymyrmex cornetzi]|uniref:Uncharacterized protein n=1 Tax=Trachymyrmex cornetzi TaxID=471704 RepID=A0A151JAS0_9HYME|nr:hypothetical protein ALC57_05373 [Trachymyrmex cornetzi]